jgi:hypothetical protein
LLGPLPHKNKKRPIAEKKTVPKKQALAPKQRPKPRGTEAKRKHAIPISISSASSDDGGLFQSPPSAADEHENGGDTEEEMDPSAGEGVLLFFLNDFLIEFYIFEK